MNPLKYYASVIFVENIDIAKDFYTQVLDCKIEHDFGKNITFFGGLSIWELSEKHIIFKQLNRTDNISNRFELYFETENIQEYFFKLQSAKIRFLHELHEEPWGQQTIRFFDPDNHLIEIGESLKTFVTRIISTGKSIKQVSEKTGIPIHSINLLLN